MSYDIRFAVKTESGKYVDFRAPEYDTPTYNIGTLFRKCMRWNFEQGKYYKVSEIVDSLKIGLIELCARPLAYKQYEPENGWGTVASARICLQSIIDEIIRIQEDYELTADEFYMAW